MQNKASKGNSIRAEDLFKAGLGNHQSGRLEEAETLYNQALKIDPFHFDALHMFGVLACQKGRYDVGIDAIHKALSVNPHEPACHSNMGKALEDLGRIEEAIVCYEKAISLKSDSVEVYCDLGNALTKLGRVEQAAMNCRRAIVLRPDYAEAHHNLARVLHKLGSLEKALEYYKKSIVLRHGFADAHNSLGTLLNDLGRTEEAFVCYKRAIELRPSFAEAQNNIGNVLRERNRLEEAIGNYEKAIVLNPELVEPHFNLGLILLKYGRLEEAKKHFQRTIQLKLDYPEALAYLSYVHEKTNDLEKAREVSKKALQLYELSPVANLVAAKCDRRQKGFQEAISKLEKIDFESANLSVQTEILFEKGKLYDRIGLYEQAFKALSSANSFQSQNYPILGVNPETYIEKVKNLESFFRHSNQNHWINPVHNETIADPVFLIGFPRSGTTLLDQILDAREKVHLLEEKPLVGAMLDWFRQQGMKYPEDLQLVDAKMHEELRRVYFDKLSEFVDYPNGNIFIDKLPLNIVDIGLIHRAFPGAKIILALRHPCDAVLSCFMQSFEPNEAVACFSDLGNTAKLYDAVMSLWAVYVEILSLKFHVVKYEDLIAEFERVTTNLFGFLKIPWDSSVADYASHAKARRPILTPSYDQVAEPIYDHAKYRWKHYIRHLEPVLPLLEPHVRRFGYPSIIRI